MVTAPSPEALRAMARRDALEALRGLSQADAAVVVAEMAAELARRSADPAVALALLHQVARERLGLAS